MVCAFLLSLPTLKLKFSTNETSRGALYAYMLSLIGYDIRHTNSENGSVSATTGIYQDPLTFRRYFNRHVEFHEFSSVKQKRREALSCMTVN